MKKKIPYETPNLHVIEWMRNEDIITTSIVDNDGDFRDWESGEDGW